MHGEPYRDCINYYSDSATSRGCFFHFLKLDAAVCCSLSIKLGQLLLLDQGPNRDGIVVLDDGSEDLVGDEPGPLPFSDNEGHRQRSVEGPSVAPSSARLNQYRAVQLSVPSSIVQLRVTHRGHQGQIKDSRTYNIDLNSGT